MVRAASIRQGDLIDMERRLQHVVSDTVELTDGQSLNQILEVYQKYVAVLLESHQKDVNFFFKKVQEVLKTLEESKDPEEENEN